MSENVRACSTAPLTQQEIQAVDAVVCAQTVSQLRLKPDRVFTLQVEGLEIPEMLLNPGEWIGAVGFSNGQAAPDETDE